MKILNYFSADYNERHGMLLAVDEMIDKLKLKCIAPGAILNLY